MNTTTPLKILYSAAQIEQRITELANEINKNHKELVIVGVLNGSFMFVSDLMKKITIPCQIDFIRVKSYIENKSSGEIVLTKGLEIDIEGKEVLIVDDIVDTGLTLTWLVTEFATYKPKKIVSAALLSRLSARATYVGFVVESDAYVIGYGLDDNKYSRNLPEIYIK